MFLATINKPKQLLYLNLFGHVRADELARGRENLVTLLAELNPGFKLITDLERLDSIDVDCAAEIGKTMEMCDEKRVGVVVRIIPDESKDIGMNILAHFHYRHHLPRTITCQTLVEAARALEL